MSLFKRVSQQAAGQHAFAILLGVAAVASRQALNGALGPAPSVLLVVPAVILSAWLGGAGPGLASMAIAVLGTLAIHLGEPSPFANSTANWRMGLVLLSCLLICVMAEQLHRARRRAQQNADAAAKLLLTEQHLGASLHSMPIFLIDMDLEFRVTRAINAPAGLDGPALVGKPADQVMEAMAASRLRAVHAELIESGRRRCIELTLRIGGRDRHFDLVVMPLRDQLGRVCGVTNVAVDITERMAERKRSQELEARFQAAQESALDAFMVLRAIREPDGRISDFEWEYINPAGAEMMRLDRGQIIGQRLLSAFPGHRDHPELFPNYVAIAETGGARRAELLYDQDGFNHWYRISVVKVGDGVAVTYSDVTEEKNATTRSEQALATAQAADRAKDEFLANLSHELRTPLNAMLGWARLVEADPDATPRTKRAADVIARNATHQAQLVSDLMDVNQILSGRIRLDVRRVDLAEVVDRAVQAVAPQATKKEIVISNSVERNLRLEGDPDRLVRAFWNLLSNAVKFTPAGGQVNVASAMLPGLVSLTVADTGAGMSAEFIPFAFERFRQADASATRQYDGLGIGLTSVKAIVELHGGEVSARSDGLGRGSSFNVVLPVVRTPANNVPTDSPASQPAQLLGGLRVLVVDDDPDARELVCEILQGSGAEVVTAPDASAAIDLWSTRSFNAIVADIAMCGIDGNEMMRRLRSSDAWPDPSIALALTAAVGDDERRRAATAGFDGVLTKPVEPVDLANALSALQRHGAPQAASPDVTAARSRGP